MYKVFMVLDENGEEVKSNLKNCIVKAVKYVVHECLTFIDVVANTTIILEELVMGVYFDESILVVKNEKSTYCFVPI